MNFQLKPESEFTQQGYLYLMEKSESIASQLNDNSCDKFSVFFFYSCRGLHRNMAEILLHIQKAKQTICDASIQSTDTWTDCKKNLGAFVNRLIKLFHFSAIAARKAEPGELRAVHIRL